jgi:hypothetical protein
MMGQYFFGHVTPRKARLHGGRPAERRGQDATGRILKLFVGQGYGFIRVASDYDVYFHRADIQAGTSINDFVIGDPVVFELIGAPVSGPPAQRVRRST